MNSQPALSGLLSLKNSFPVLMKRGSTPLGSVTFFPKSPMTDLEAAISIYRLQLNTSKLGHPSGEFQKIWKQPTPCLIWLRWEWWMLVKMVPMVPCSALMFHLVG